MPDEGLVASSSIHLRTLMSQEGQLFFRGDHTEHTQREVMLRERGHEHLGGSSPGVSGSYLSLVSGQPTTRIHPSNRLPQASQQNDHSGEPSLNCKFMYIFDKLFFKPLNFRVVCCTEIDN